MPHRCVAHLDMDAFYVSVELRRRPELSGRPVIVAGTGPRAVVTTASYEARRFGVGSAIPASRARRLCPAGIFLAPDFPLYRAASGEVMGIVRRQVPVIEVIGLDEAYLDLSGVPDSVAAMHRLRDEIEQVTGLRCSIGLGPNKLVAKVASDADKPRGFVALSAAGARERFAGASCGLVPGIGPKTVQRLRELGVGSLGELAAADPSELAARFGARAAAELQRRARFEDDSPVSQERKVVSESRETTFDRDLVSLPELERELEELARRLCEALVAQGRGGRTVGIKVRLDDFSTHTRARTLPQIVATDERVTPVAVDLLRRFAPWRPVRLIGVRVTGLGPAGRAAPEQLSLTV